MNRGWLIGPAGQNRIFLSFEENDARIRFDMQHEGEDINFSMHIYECFELRAVLTELLEIHKLILNDERNKNGKEMDSGCDKTSRRIKGVASCEKGQENSCC